MSRVKILIIHDQYQIIGGAEMQNLEIMSSLSKDDQYTVASVSFDGPKEIAKLSKISGISPPSQVRFYTSESSPAHMLLNAPPYPLHRLPKIQYLASYSLKFQSIVRKAMRDFNPNVIYFDLWRSSRFFSEIKSVPTLLYSYLPPFGYLLKYVPKSILLKMSPHNAYLLTGSRSLLYLPLVELDRSLYININEPTIVFSLSSLVDRLIRIERKKRTELLFPPINVSPFLRSDNSNNRKDIVITLGRIDQEKNLEQSIRILSRVNVGKLLIVGSLLRMDTWYLRKLYTLAKELGVSDRVLFVTNAPFSQIFELLKKSKIVLFPQEWGHSPYASIVEAMASGCVPVVPKQGTPWEDIVQMGRFGFGYSTIEEAANIIELLFSDSKSFKYWSSIAKKRASDFAQEIFMAKLKSYIQQLAR